MLKGLSTSTGANASLNIFKSALIALAAIGLTACASGNVGVDIPGVPGSTRTGNVVNPGARTVETMRDKEGILPPFMEGRRVVRAAVLLPFSHTNPQIREQSDGLLRGAELALFEQGVNSVVLLPKDSGSTPEAAGDAARLALKDGADIILGPLLAPTVRSAGDAARAKNVPLIAFTNDRSVAQPGNYILSFTADQEVDRIVSYAAKKGYKNFALLAPNNEFGTRLDAAFRASVTRYGGVVTVSQRYPRDPSTVNTAISAAAAALRQTPGKQAILIPERGNLLRAIAPALIINKVDLTRNKLLGTSLWAEEDVTKEPALKGGWYAAPDPEAHAAFERRYEQAFGKRPSKLASLSYDAMALSTALGANGPQGISRAGIENPDGFSGADGLFRFMPDGTAQRGLSVLEIGSGAARTIDASPRKFSTPGT